MEQQTCKQDSAQLLVAWVVTRSGFVAFFVVQEGMDTVTTKRQLLWGGEKVGL